MGSLKKKKNMNDLGDDTMAGQGNRDGRVQWNP